MGKGGGPFSPNLGKGGRGARTPSRSLFSLKCPHRRATLCTKPQRAASRLLALPPPLLPGLRRRCITLFLVPSPLSCHLFCLMARVHHVAPHLRPVGSLGGVAL
eukprot:6192672-Pleurochrysis_carterae.AAC.6